MIFSHGSDVKKCGFLTHGVNKLCIHGTEIYGKNRFPQREMVLEQFERRRLYNFDELFSVMYNFYAHVQCIVLRF